MSLLSMCTSVSCCGFFLILEVLLLKVKWQFASTKLKAKRSEWKNGGRGGQRGQRWVFLKAMIFLFIQAVENMMSVKLAQPEIVSKAERSGIITKFNVSWRENLFWQAMCLNQYRLNFFFFPHVYSITKEILAKGSRDVWSMVNHKVSWDFSNLWWKQMWLMELHVSCKQDPKAPTVICLETASYNTPWSHLDSMWPRGKKTESFSFSFKQPPFIPNFVPGTAFM